MGFTKNQGAFFILISTTITIRISGVIISTYAGKQKRIMFSKPILKPEQKTRNGGTNKENALSHELPSVRAVSQLIVDMDWHPGQGPLGGWRCPKCGLKIDYKGR